MPKSMNGVDPQYLMFFPYYGRHGQDKFLHEEVFKDKKNGLFVDVGAYDGVESSNTLFFEESMEWNGICIEPLPNAFSRLQVNRKCLCLNTCASDKDTYAEFMHVVPEKIIKNQGQERIPNFEKLSGLIEFYSSEHKELIDRTLMKVGGRKEIFKAKCTQINAILAQLPSSKINLLSIDTEGSELHIIQAIDFTRFDIEVIVLEVLYPNDDLSKFMKKNGYTLLKKIGYDWIYG